MKSWSYIFQATAFVAVTVAAWSMTERSRAAAVCAVSPPEEATAREHRVSLIFAGDLMLHMPQVLAARTASGYDFRPSLRYVKPYLEQADLAVVNLETTLSDNGSYTGYPCFSSPREVVDALVDAGVDVALTANNHCCDRSAAGIGRTQRFLHERGILSAGSYADSTDWASRNPLYVSRDSVRFAILNYTYSTNGIPVRDGTVVNMLDSVRMAADITHAAAQADCIIACLHWGNEYQRTPSRAQRRMAAWLHRAGVDIVVGSHPHVIQPIEADSTQVTLYSLGNFASNQQQRYTDGGIMAQIEVCKRGRRMRYATRVVPVWVMHPQCTVLPEAVADTLRMEPWQRARYALFRDDTRRMCGLQ